MRNMGRYSRKHMTKKVPDQHVHVHPHSLIRVFAIEKKNKKKKRNAVLSCLLDLQVRLFFLNTLTLYAQRLSWGNKQTNK